MPNTNKQLDNIIKQLVKVVGGSTNITHTYASIPQKVDYANKLANRLKLYSSMTTTTTTSSTTTTTTTAA